MAISADLDQLLGEATMATMATIATSYEEVNFDAVS
jgi:hypothetical protein